MSGLSDSVHLLPVAPFPLNEPCGPCLKPHLVIRYVFLNSEDGGWIKAGKRHCVVLRPRVERVDESEDLLMVQAELEVGHSSDDEPLGLCRTPPTAEAAANRFNSQSQLRGKRLDDADRSVVQEKLSSIARRLEQLLGRR